MTYSKSSRKPSKSYLRNKADKLFQDYFKAKYPCCLVCGAPTNCAHHFCTKASSNALRYYIPNGIPLCKGCHCLVHCQPHLIEPTICFNLGEDWYKDLIEVKRQGVKVNRAWYQSHIEELEILGGK